MIFVSSQGKTKPWLAMKQISINKMKATLAELAEAAARMAEAALKES